MPTAIMSIPVKGREADVVLEGDLVVPDGAGGVVLFAHGSGSSRHSPRNRYVAEVLNRAGFATLLLDLLTPEEEAAERLTRHLRFDIDLLADRLTSAADWLAQEGQPTARLLIGLFGASTGGGAALVMATARPLLIQAVVSRGGRPDLAADSLPLVQAPTLLIVGEWDEQVITLNQQAAEQMRSAPALRIEIVPGATHLFEEPGTLEEVARLATDWFRRYLGSKYQR